MTKKKFETPKDYRYLETEYLVHDCDHERLFLLWKEWHDQMGVPWNEESRGSVVTIGHLDKRPIVVEVWWAHVATKRVAFVDGCSQLVDYKMVEDWYHDAFPNVKSYSNPINFHNIVDAITRALKVKSICEYEYMRNYDKPRERCENFLVTDDRK